MNRYSFTYLVVVYLLFGIYTLNGEIDIDHQLKAALVLMSFFGIPHGAIDNVLFLSKHKMPWMRKEEHPFVRITSSRVMPRDRKVSRRWPSATDRQVG